MGELPVLLIGVMDALFAFFVVAPMLLNTASLFGVQKQFAKAMVEEGVIDEATVKQLHPKKQITGVLISLELEVGKPVEKIVEVTKEVPVIRDVKVSTPASNPNMAAELAAAKAKCEMLQTMYESLLNRVLAGKAG